MFPTPSRQRYSHDSYELGLIQNDLGETFLKEMIAFMGIYISSAKEGISAFHEYLVESRVLESLELDWEPNPELCFLESALQHANEIELSILPNEGGRGYVHQRLTPHDTAEEEIILADKIRLAFKRAEINGLPPETWVRFRIRNSGGGKADPRVIDGWFRCRGSDISTFFDTNNDRDWNENGWHSWSRFPVWAEAFFEGTLIIAG
jgi:hypothetical protein